FLQQLRANYQQAIREKRELAAEGKGDNHPAMKKADEKVVLARGHLLEEIKNIQGAVARDLAIIGRQEAGEAGLYEKARKRAVELNMKELEFHRLDRLRAQNEKLYSMLLEQVKEADLRRMMNTNNVRLVDPATEARAPIRPRVDVSLGVGALVGLLLGLGLVLLKEQLDNTLKTPEDVEDRLGVTFLGLLPEVADDAPDRKGGKTRTRRPGGTELAPELIVHERPLSGVAEAARSLRTNLTFMTPDKPFRKILVTSAAPSEGKTTVATSIAISLAQGGHRVCIIDCDLRRPRLHRVFGREGDMGLTNVLLGEATIDDVALPTVVPNLYSIPCGPIPPNPADTVASERFKRFLDEMLEHFDRVVIDSPPIVAVTDPAIISTLVDAVIFVVRAFHTPMTLSRSGLRTLRDVDAPVAGAVLNAVNLNRHEYAYHHYYYYKREGYAPHSPPIPVEPEDNTRPPAAPPN
ncbi:MAG: polysaccharide biosynthesis tyrosine autokinase, partial [Myxococcales bacterium]|nr:polysaccharide biosynthesis tyrosine autokinase [Myxococcales bacterium]